MIHDLRLRNGDATKPICGGWQPFSPSGHHPNRDSPKAVAGPSVAFGVAGFPSSTRSRDDEETGPEGCRPLPPC